MRSILLITLATWTQVVCGQVIDIDFKPTASPGFQQRPVGFQIGEFGPTAPEYPDFDATNRAARFSNGASLRVTDLADGSSRFDNGDEMTLEAWVDVTHIRGHAYLIGKGRTYNKGYARDNQNWALRLTSQSNGACLNFLFRSRPQPATDDQPAHPGGWHRWTSQSGFAPGSGWHHVAITYRFGDPDSLRGYVDGHRVTGVWDMDGATRHPPVVDDDEVWLGSSMGGSVGNSLEGYLDNVAVHRRILTPETLAKRYRYEPQPIGAPEVPPGKVVVELYGRLPSINSIPSRPGRLLTQWTQNEMAFVSLPHKYDDWGIREDWGTTLLVRATTDIQPPAGTRRLMLRSRGLARLWIDDRIIATTKPQQNRGSAHHVVDPLSTPPVPGMRPLAMNDQEKIVSFDFDGESHRVVYEAIVGGPGFRAEFGENGVAIDSDDDPMFALLAKQRTFPWTDDGWQRFVKKQSVTLQKLDAQRRRQASTSSADYWRRRHLYAQQNLLDRDSRQASIDDLIAQRIEQANQPAESETSSVQSAFFREQVQPIFAQHCYRCHGEKQQGGLNLKDRANLLAGGESETPAIVPGSPDESYLLELVSAPEDDYRMPPKNEGMTLAQVAIIRRWIEQGAAMPAPLRRTIQPTTLTADEAFLRRVYVDCVGVAPTADEAHEFLRDSSNDRRTRLIDRLLDDPRVADNWVGYWQDVLAENPNLLKPMLNNTGPFRWWIHEALADNKPLDRFASELIMMRGSIWDGGTAGFAVASQNDAPMAAKAFVIGSAFLGVQMKCARCHDAPYHQWKQGDLFQLAAMLQRQPIKLPATSTVPPAFFETQARESLISVTIKPGEKLLPTWPFPELAPEISDDLLNDPNDSRERLAARLTLSRRFAEIMANRIWGRLMGLALVEPVDDWEGNPPSDPELLDFLADRLIASGYDLREFCKLVMNSAAYQRQAVDRATGMDPNTRLYAGPYRRRMTAEQVVDTALHAVGQPMQTEALTLDIEGTLPAHNFLNFGHPRRAWEFTTLANERDRPSLALPRVQAITDVMKAFGWRDSRPEPLTTRDETPNLIQPAVLANGAFGTSLSRLSDNSGITKLALSEQSLDDFLDDLFLSLLTRLPSESERDKFTELLAPGYEHRIVPLAEVGTPRTPTRFPHVSWSNHLNTEANKIKVEMEALVRQGPPPTRFLADDWRSRAEDAVWSLLNCPEMVMIP